MRSLRLIPDSQEGTDESTLPVEWQPVSRSISRALSDYTQETLIFRRAGCQRAHRWVWPRGRAGEARLGHSGSSGHC